ncbi:hypothetical protein AB5N19_12966 [Seiridium cardinale]|uniref:Uncharacterized protein n=1 Tax=Seiridium cardinale TaxID=138064 RepID=A0ABR2XRD4_9PEZI
MESSEMPPRDYGADSSSPESEALNMETPVDGFALNKEEWAAVVEHVHEIEARQVTRWAQQFRNWELGHRPDRIFHYEDMRNLLSRDDDVLCDLDDLKEEGVSSGEWRRFASRVNCAKELCKLMLNKYPSTSKDSNKQLYISEREQRVHRVTDVDINEKRPEITIISIRTYPGRACFIRRSSLMQTIGYYAFGRAPFLQDEDRCPNLILRYYFGEPETKI